MPTETTKKAIKRTVAVTTKKATKSTRSSKKLPPIPPKPVFYGLDGVKLKKILITQPKPENDKSPYFDIAKRYKLNIDFRPFFEIQGITAKEFRRYRISLHDFTAVIFTSRNSIDNFFRLSAELKMMMSSETKYFCTTESIGLYLQKFIQYRKRKVFYGDGTIKDLLSIIAKHKDEERYLMPRGESPNTEISNFLHTNKFNYLEELFYRNVPCEIKDIKVDNYDLLVFFSPSGIEALKKNFPKFKQKAIKMGAFGPATCLAVKDYGFELHLPAPQPTLPSMSSAIEAYLKENKLGGK